MGALEYQFDVLEYLKGSGGNSLVAVVNGYATLGEHSNIARATKHGEVFLAERDTRWDDREAIVFLKDNDSIITSTQQPGRYLLGGTGGALGNGYTLSSRFAKKWLPAAEADGASGAAVGDKRRFLIDDLPTDPNFEFYATAAEKEQRRLNSSMTLAELKAHIATIGSEPAAGDGSKEYRDCLVAKYEWEQELRYFELSDKRYEYEFESGLRAGRWVYEDWRTYHTREHIVAFPDDPHPEYWLEGKDHSLFYVEHPGVVFATRPLPMGEYRMYFQVRGHKYIICDAYPESERTRYEYVVQVKAPPGTLHEAFFDPVALDDAVGADGESGVLKPAAFAFDGTDAKIKRIDWHKGHARITLAPRVSLADHHIDFIALDGSGSLRLDFDDAVEVADDNDGQTFAWGVCEQPWRAGDLLMLRISKSPASLAKTTFDDDCAPAASTQTPTPTPSPTPTATP